MSALLDDSKIETSPLEALRILVVEDHNFQRKVIVHMLNSLGVREIRQAANGKQALELLQSNPSMWPDIIMCDLDMPEMDGMEFLRLLARNHQGISIIILSGMDGTLISSVEKMAYSYGLNLLGAAEKPICAPQLEQMLKLFDQKKHKTRNKTVARANYSLGEVMEGVRLKQFEPYLQPKVDLRSGRIIGAEALARWRHPEHGVLDPYAFIPLLEQNGQMEEFTLIMLEKSANICKQLHLAGKHLSLSVNLSLSSLSDTTLANRITQIVRDAGVDPHNIMLEVTESAAMTNEAEALENLARLRMRGFGLSIDDYGTGFSSMQQLTRVPFTELKIDRSFVTDCATNRSLRVIIESSIDMARKLRVKSVAEGVEKTEEWDMLKEMSCDVVQGYLIAKPMSNDEFNDFHTKYSPASFKQASNQ